MEHQPDKWISDYQRDGFLVVPDVLDAETLAGLSQQIDRITADLDALPNELRRCIETERDFLQQPGSQKYNHLGLHQVGHAVRKIMELPLFSPPLAELICYEPLLDVLETLFNTSEFHFHNYKCVIKAPRVSSTLQWHRDLPYLNHSTPNLITAMLCLDPMTEENGATVVYPGTHRLPAGDVREDDTEIHDHQLPTDVQPITITCPAGSAVLFHVNIIHGGGPNRSDMPRRNIIGIWAGPDAWPITSNRYAFGEVCPRSKDPARQAQMRLTFPRRLAAHTTTDH